MPVNQDDFPGCCTAIVLTDFGDSHTSEYGFHDYGYQRIRKSVIDEIKEARRDCGIITAILTSEQTKAKDVLKELGFIGTGEAEKGRHEEVTIELYYLHCKGWEEPNAAVEPPRPRDAQGRFLPAQQQAVNPFVAQPVQQLRWKAVSTLNPAAFVKAFSERTGYVVYGPEPLIFDSLERRVVDQVRQQNRRPALNWVQVFN